MTTEIVTEREKKLAKRVFELEAELDAIKRLLPICSSCHDVRNEQDEWHSISNFLTSIGIQPTHSICPKCKKKLYPQLCED